MLHWWASMKHRDSHNAWTKDRGLARTMLLLVADTHPASPSRGRRELWALARDGSRITRHDAPDSPTRR